MVAVPCSQCRAALESYDEGYCDVLRVSWQLCTDFLLILQCGEDKSLLKPRIGLVVVRRLWSRERFRSLHMIVLNRRFTSNNKSVTSCSCENHF